MKSVSGFSGGVRVRSALGSNVVSPSQEGSIGFRGPDVGFLVALGLSLATACADSGGATLADLDDEGDNPSDTDIADVTDDDGTPQPAPRGLSARIIPNAASAHAWVEGPGAAAMAGDVLLQNEHVRFIIQAPGTRSRGWLPYSGSVVDACLLTPSGEPGAEPTCHDTLGELAVMVGFIRVFEAQSLEILSDGSNGTEVRVRMTGRDGGIPLIDFALSEIGGIAVDSLGLRVETEWSLRPDDFALRIETRVTNPGSRSHERLLLGDGTVWGNRTRPFAPGQGFERKAGTVKGLPWHMSIGETHGYALVPAPRADAGSGTMDSLYVLGIEGTNISPYRMFEWPSLPPGSEARYVRYFAVGADFAVLRRTIAALQGETLADLTATVSFADPADREEVTAPPILLPQAIARPWVEVLDGEGKPHAFDFIRSGTPLTIPIPAGSYTLRTMGEGWPEGTPTASVTIPSGAPISVPLPATGRIRFEVVGEIAFGADSGRSEGSIPAKIALQTGRDAPLTARFAQFVHSATGVGVMRAPPGEYMAVVARGLEYEPCRVPITVVAGETTPLRCVLKRVVDTTGWVSTDLHIHTERSVDAYTAVETRIVQLAAEGIERPVITDHDVITDLDPLARALGLGAHIRFTTGTEISPLWGHSNMYPIVDRPDRPVYFGTPWLKGYDAEGRFLGGREMPDIWRIAREDFQARLAQVNHPRGGTAWFDSLGWSPDKPVSTLDPARWSGTFDAVEVINSGDVDRALNAIIPDLYSLYNQGLRPAAVGVSDTHTHSNPGHARSYLRVGSDDPRAVDDDAFTEAIAHRRVLACSGPFIEAAVTSAHGRTEIGDTAVLPGGVGTLSIIVRAAAFVPVDWVRVVVNGALWREFSVDGSAVERFGIELPLTLSTDVWIVVLAGAPTKTLAPVQPGQRVLTMANPIFIDADGNGYQAPGLGAEFRPTGLPDATTAFAATGGAKASQAGVHSDLSAITSRKVEAHSHGNCGALQAAMASGWVKSARDLVWDGDGPAPRFEDPGHSHGPGGHHHHHGPGDGGHDHHHHHGPGDGGHDHHHHHGPGDDSLDFLEDWGDDMPPYLEGESGRP